jgi:hypothetical protein
MTRFFTRRTTTADTLPDAEAAPAGTLLRDPLEAHLCVHYAPGHQMHYVHQGQALRSPARHASNVIVEGHRVVVVLDSGEELQYQHHEPERLSSVLGLFPGSRVVYPEFHALRVGPYWFNCAPDHFEPCGSPAEAAGS